MTRSYFDGHDHYVIYGVETAYGSGAVSATNRVSKLQDVSFTFSNNIQLSQGVGEGADATSSTYGNFDVTGSMNIKPTELHFLQFGSGTVTGTGTTADPYKIIDGNNIGYSGTFVRTALFEIGATSTSNNQAYNLSGCSVNSWTLSGNQGEELNASLDFTSGSMNRSTSVTGYTGDSRSTYTFTSGSIGWAGEFLDCTNFSITNNFPNNYPREVMNRFGKQPTKGVRRYNWTLTVNKHYDDASGQMSGVELLDEFFGSSNVPKTDGLPTGKDLLVHIRDGTSSGDKQINLQLANSYINDWAESPSLEAGVTTITVNGVSLSSQTESGNKVCLKWWDET